MKDFIKESIAKQNLSFLVILLCVLMQIFTLGSPYRFFAYLNIIVVSVSLYLSFKENKHFKNLFQIKSFIYYPIVIFLLHFLSVLDFSIIKEMRHTIISCFLAVGLALLAYKNHDYLRKHIKIIVMLLISIYIIGQLIAIWIFGKHYGTAKNPHYLALYSAISIIFVLYFFYQSSSNKRFLLVIYLIPLVFLLLETGSRPAWIGLFFSLIIATFFLNKTNMVRSIVGIVAFASFLFFTNLGGFADRSQDLIDHVNTEERVTIWHETVEMQMTSSPYQWLVGHGIDTFEENFKPYSSYHLQGIDFNSPHNYFLELLYLSGIAGLVVFFSFYWTVYKKIFMCIKNNERYKDVYILLFIIFTTHFIFASITLPYFYGPSLNITAYVIGMLFYLDALQTKRVAYE